MRFGFIGAGNMASAIIRGMTLVQKAMTVRIFSSQVNPAPLPRGWQKPAAQLR